MAFRFQGKYAFLTYAQADGLSKDAIIWALRDKVPSPEAWAVGEEEHQDGGKHFHAILRYAERVDIRDARFWDVEGFHPNIQSARGWKQVLQYCIKGGDYISDGFEVGQVKVDIFTVVKEEVARDGTVTECITAIMERTGTAGLRLYNQIQGYVERVKKPLAVHQIKKYYPDDFLAVDDVLGGHLHKFLTDMAMGPGMRGNRKSLWIYGPSRMGKTVLARSLGSHWYMMGAWNVECYDDRADYGVMDDIDWDNLKRYYKGIMGLQQDVTVTDKYKKKSVINGGRPVIMVSNALPTFTVDEAAWLERNVSFHYVGTPVFDGPPEE